MKRALLAVFFVLALCGTAFAQYQYPTVFDVEGEAAQFDELSSMTSATGFTASKVCVDSSGGGKVCAKAALVTVETAGVRFTLHGTDPTTSYGHPMNAGDSYVIRGFGNVQRAKFINSSEGNGAVIKATLFF